ncbi:MAG: VanW family protein [Eubacteriales bacterium]
MAKTSDKKTDDAKTNDAKTIGTETSTAETGSPKTNMSKLSGPKTRKAIVIGAIAVVVVALMGAAYYYTTAERPLPAAAVTEQTSVPAVTQPAGPTLEEMKKLLDVDTIYPGISINGTDVSGKTKAEAALLFEDKASSDTSKIAITLDVDGVEYALDPALFATSSDISAAIDDAYNYNRTSTAADESQAIADRYQILLDLQKTPKNFDTAYTTAEDEITNAVHSILDPLETQPVDAVATSFDTQKLVFVIDDSKPGVDIDVDAAAKDVLAAIDAKDYKKVITVGTTAIEPKVSKEELASLLGLVSSTTTKTSNKPNRNVNIDLVCKTEDGLVLQPGESFNFNKFIGQRTSAKGYKEAPGIYGGTTRMELGGGICQTTGTLFHSVMMADLQVDERHPHSWPSDYVDIGTDATVTWGGSNFQFTNNTEYPIAIHAYYKDLHVTMEIYGRPVADGMIIKIEGDVTSRSGPGPTQFVPNPAAAAGSKSSVRGSHDYITANCYKVYYKDGVEVKRVLAFKSTYNSINAIVSVGVLAPDGSICAMDPATGAVVMPAVAVPPVETAPPATEPAATTAPPATTTPTTTPEPTAATTPVPVETTTAPL